MRTFFKTLMAFYCLLQTSTTGNAQLRFYNACDKPIYVAVKYLGKYNNSNWTTKGWFQVAPGQYITVIEEEIYNRYIYFYAKTDDSKLIWSGNQATCVSYSAFNYNDIFSNQGCPDILNFSMIDTKDYKVFTQSLSCEGQSENEVNERTYWPLIDVLNMALPNYGRIAPCSFIKSVNMLTLESAYMTSNGEHSWRDPAALGLEIMFSDDLETWYTVSSSPLIGLHYAGVESKGACKGYAKMEWYDYEKVRYQNYGILSWNNYADYKYIRFRITEGDHEYDPSLKIKVLSKAIDWTPARWVPGLRSSFKNDVVFDVYERTENLKDGRVVKIQAASKPNGPALWVQTK